MWQRFLLVAGMGMALITAQPAAAAPGDATAFITDLGAQAIHVLQTTSDAAPRKAAFSKIFTQNFDVPAIGKFVLGRYWRTATPDQQKQYIQIFGQYVVALYSNRFAGYSGQEFKVLGSQDNGPDIATVTSQIIPPNGGPPTNVGWQVAKEGTTYKITDVTIENLSMAITKREEFASVLSQNGGNVQELIDQLKQKVAES